MRANTQLCPLCQQVNLCARATDPMAADCWCRHQTFPEQLPELPGNRCLCQACIEKLRLANAAVRQL